MRGMDSRPSNSRISGVLSWRACARQARSKKQPIGTLFIRRPDACQVFNRLKVVPLIRIIRQNYEIHTAGAVDLRSSPQHCLQESRLAAAPVAGHQERPWARVTQVQQERQAVGGNAK